MSVFTSKVVRNMYGTEEMRRIFSEDTRIENFVRIEVALAKVESELGLIPVSAYKEIAEKSKTFNIDWERFRIDVEAVGYPVSPFLKQLTEACGPAGEYLHWGSTTRDITDTSFVMQLGAALAVMEKGLVRVKTILLDMSQKHRSTVMIARTHGMHALPTTFGFRTAVWLSEVDRQLLRLARVRSETVVGQFGGAVGTLAAVGERGLEVQAALMQELGLQAPDISWFASRDRVSEVVFTIASIAQTMASVANTLLAMTHNEVGEARESGTGGRGTSSAMPHKHNTVGCELIVVHGKMATQQVAIVMQSMVQDYERDWQGHFETIAVSQTFQHGHAAVKQLADVLLGMQIYPDKMRANLELTKGQIMAESVMMLLATRLGRKQAHKMISDLCNLALEKDTHLRDVLHEDADLAKHLSEAEIDYALEPLSYVGLAREAVDKVVESSRRVCAPPEV